jgi:hypothetical protein
MSGISTTTANAILNALCRGEGFSVPTVYVQLHTGDPGKRGIAHPALETERMQLTFGTPASATIASNVAATWANITGSEKATHFSAWDRAVQGTFLFSGTVDAHPYLSGDTLSIPAGSLSSSIVVAQ